MFHSITTITLTNIGVITLLVFLVTRHNPLKTFIGFFVSLKKERLLLYHLLAALTVLLLNKIELTIEDAMNVQADFTPFFYQIEGPFIHLIQTYLETPPLTAVLTFFYIIVFTSLLVASLFIYFHDHDRRSLYTLLYAVMLNYLIAIPFFLFFPVLETWVIHPQVEFLIPQIYPAFEQEYRAVSGLDNCFPSLHTSMSVTLAVIAARSKNRLFGKIVPVCTGIILFSIFYLGIHWFLDAASGTVLALISVHFASRLANDPIGGSKLPPQPTLYDNQTSDLD